MAFPVDFQISLDLRNTHINQTNIQLTSNDAKAYSFIFKVYDNSKSIDYNDFEIAVIAYLRPDKEVIIRDLTNTGSDLRVMVELDEISIAGIVQAQIQFRDTRDGSRLTAIGFSFAVKEAIRKEF